ncbi:DUF4871 domain-containing protein [Cohnella kolymensis]|uniref:DUF4871 domain-containing protein n=1 Tax=Cohnella kolymensis TaxID=1590652 RepID=UPI0006977CAB|nr:DUF4871 domain-containing protein [Cohnella kolymensis]
MEFEKPDWAAHMEGSPFNRSHFTPELQQRITQTVNSKKPPLPRKVWAVSMAAVSLILIIAALSLPGGRIPFLPSGARQAADTEVRQQYTENGRQLLAVFPDPNLEAGKTTGYLFHFTASFEEFRGRQLSIEAEHLDTGLKVTVQKPLKITEPSSGYPGLERFVAFAGLPISGKWRYVVQLDGEDYANVVLQVREASWEQTPEFRSGVYLMRGIEKEVGFIDAGFIAGKVNKYMWHFWGSEEELEGKFQVKAIKQGDTRIINVFEASNLGGKNNGADAHIPSSMSLPEPGRWRLLPYLDDRLLPSIVVEVKQTP